MYDRSGQSVLCASLLSSLLTSLITNPIEIIKLRKQASLSCCSLQGCDICLVSPYKLPLNDYFRGLLTNSKAIMISNVLFLQLYESMLKYLKGKGVNNSTSFLLASVGSRGIISLLTIPLENKRINKSLKNPISRLAFKGIKATVTRDMIFSGLYWSLVENIRTAFTKKPDYRETQKARSQLFYINMVSASVAGFVSAGLTSPLDLVKTRLQAGMMQNTGLLSGVRQVAKIDGIRGVFRGAGIRVFKSVVHCCTMMVFFQEFNKMFRDRGL